MRPIIATATALALLSACSPGGPGPRNEPLAANPSAMVAAELAFARLAQEKGQWTAFRETSHQDAMMFVPQRVRARDWLQGRADPPAAVKWQPHGVYSSCDGTAGATTGAWQAPKGSVGYFTTVWLREPNGKLRWVLDHAVEITTAREAPEFIASKLAICGTRPGVAISVGAEGEDQQVGLSNDQTMSWTSTVRADGSRRVTIKLWDGSAMAPVIDDQVAAGN